MLRTLRCITLDSVYSVVHHSPEAAYQHGTYEQAMVSSYIAIGLPYGTAGWRSSASARDGHGGTRRKAERVAWFTPTYITIHNEGPLPQPTGDNQSIDVSLHFSQKS